MKAKNKILTTVLVCVCAVLSVVGVLLFALKDNNQQNPQKTVAEQQIVYDGNAEETGAALAPIKQKGGCIYVSPGSEYTMSSGTISAHKNTYGGAVYVANGGKFVMTGGTITGCEAEYGGAIYVEAGGTLIISGGSITANRSSTAAIYIEAGAADDCTIDESVVHDNQIVERFYINFYVDGVLHSVQSVLNTTFDLETEKLPIDLLKCCGYFYNSALTNFIDGNFIDFEDSEYVVDNEINLYTKLATLDELVFSVNEAQDAYCASISATGYKQEVVIPAQYGILPVNQVSAQDNITSIQSVVLPSSIKIIGNNAFDGANLLQTVNMLDTITTIGDYAFNGCKKLTKIVIPSALSSLGAYAFYGCNNAYYTDTLSIPEGIEEIKDYTFYDCDDVEEFIIPSTVKNIGSYAFAKCELISQIQLPEGLKGLNTQAFAGCSGLTSIEIPYGIKKLYSNTFNGCTSLESASIPETVTAISSYVFSSCTSLTDVQIPSAVTEISVGAFYKCSSLTEITIPLSVTKMGSNVFGGCTGMENIYCEAWQKPENWNVDWYGDCSAYISWGQNQTAQINYFVDGELLNTVTVEENWYNLNEDDMPLSNEECCGYFFDDALTQPVLSDSVEITSSVVNLYTKPAVIPEGATLTESRNYYSLKLAENSGAGNAPEFAPRAVVASNVTDVVMPAYYNGLPIKYVNAKNSNITSFVFNNKIEIISESAFNNCGSLNGSITIPSNVKKVDEKAFYYCTRLTSVNLSEGVTSIGASAFLGCSGIVDVNLPNSLVFLGESVFNGCYCLERVVFGDNIREIPSQTFFGCTSLENVTLGNNIETIGEQAFYNCSCEYFSEIVLPDSVKTIEAGAFSNCSSLNRVDLNNVQTIGRNAFKGCTTLTLIYVRASAQTVGESAFSRVPSTATIYCGALSQPAGWSSLWKSSCSSQVVWGYEYEKSINIYVDGILETTLTFDKTQTSYTFDEANMPVGLESCCGYFLDYELIETIKGDIDLTQGQINLYTKRASDLKLFNFTHNEENSVYEISAKSYNINVDIVIPQKYKGLQVELAEYAFGDCCSLGNVTLPSGLTVITSNAFYCVCIGNMKRINIPDTVSTIQSYAFSEVYDLTSITIPNSVVNIDDYAFTGCYGAELMSVVVQEGNPVYDSRNGCNMIIETLANKVIKGCNNSDFSLVTGITCIGSHAFMNCSRLTSITIPNSVTSIGNDAFSYCSSLTSITIPGGVTSIGDSVFRHCSSLTSITIPEGVTSIGNDAFSGCSSLTSVTIPEGVTNIGGSAFSYCTSLTSITIPEGVTSIGVGIFGGCSSLTSITIPDGLTSIGDYAFSGCSSLTSITIPDGLTSIGDSVFEYCSSLTSVTIPEGVTSIGERAFGGCISLTSITIPNSVISIGGGAFADCDSLKHIYIPSSVTTVGIRAFGGCSETLTIYCRASQKLSGWDNKWNHYDYNNHALTVSWGYTREEYEQATLDNPWLDEDPDEVMPDFDLFLDAGSSASNVQDAQVQNAQGSVIKKHRFAK